MQTLMKLITISLSAVWLTVSPAMTQDVTIKSHGISTFGDLKYGPNFKHFDYVNPNAPKGGEFSTWGFGTFDSMTPYILKQMAGELTRKDVEKKIEFYTNKNK